MRTNSLLVGVDIGSTTTKVAALDAATRQLLYADYQRHHAAQAVSVIQALEKLGRAFPGAQFRFAFTGSGSKPLAEALALPYVQEVVANSIALRADYADVGTAIELGGQDAKIIFFRRSPSSGALDVADMRMNGSCAARGARIHPRH